LCGAPDPWTRGQPRSRRRGGGGRVAGLAGIPGGDAPRPDGERLPPRWDRLRRPAGRGRCRPRPPAPALHDLTSRTPRRPPRAGRPRASPSRPLPVQSGSDRILASMRRGYTREGYLQTIDRLRQEVPHLALSSDIIVGYPGESQEDFEATVDLVDAVGFDSL